jgi:hypothetical protein
VCEGDPPVCVPVVLDARMIGTLPNGESVLAKDLGVNVSNGTTIRYFFGDTLGLWNADGTIATNSGAQAPTGDPLATTNFPSAQVIPFTAEESLWNLEGIALHTDRWALPPCGAVREGALDARVFYMVDQPIFYSSVAGAFYDLFPMRALGTAVLPATDTVVVRDMASEITIAANEWPTGFHRLPDGSVRFFIEEVSDTDPVATFRRARWTATGGFVIEPSPIFDLDAVVGVSVFWSDRFEQWLVTWIDRTGAIRLSGLRDDGVLIDGEPALVYRIPGWNRPWDGYLAAHIDGADTNAGTSFLLLYSRATSVFSSELPVIQVTIR